MAVENDSLKWQDETATQYNHRKRLVNDSTNDIN